MFRKKKAESGFQPPRLIIERSETAGGSVRYTVMKWGYHGYDYLLDYPTLPKAMERIKEEQGREIISREQVWP